MKFFTRELYQRMQLIANLSEEEEDKYEDEGERLWDEALEQYQNHLESIKPSLQEDVHQFLGLSLHDTRINSITHEGDSIIIMLETKNAPWIEGDLYSIVFLNAIFSGSKNSVQNDWWLYEEVYLSDSTSFELHVLCEKSEFQMGANKIEVIRKI